MYKNMLRQLSNTAYLFMLVLIKAKINSLETIFNSLRTVCYITIRNQTIKQITNQKRFYAVIELHIYELLKPLDIVLIKKCASEFRI